MADFANTLSSVLKKNKLYVTHVAADSGVDRTLLSKAIKGDRPLSPHTFKKILDKLNVPSEDHELLIRSYIEDQIGYNKFLKYVETIKKISKEETLTSVSADYASLSVNLHFEDGIMKLISQNDILNVARQITSYSIKGENGKLYSNFQLDKMIDIMRHFPNHKLDFKHVIDNISKEKKFIAFSNMLDLMSLGYTSNYYPSSGGSLSPNQLFPYYIITDDYILFADSETNVGYLSDNKSIIDIYTKAFLKNYEHTTVYISKYDDILMCKDNVLKTFNSSINRLIFLDRCGSNITYFLTLDMWEQIAKPDVPNRNFLRDTTYQYYQNTYKSISDRICHFFSITSLKDFVDHGIVETMPKEFAYPLNKENRIKVLKAMYDNILNNNLPFYIVDDKNTNIDVTFDIEIFEKENNAGTLHIYSETENSPLHYTGNLVFTIDDPQIVYDFSDFFNCFIVSDYCLSKEKSFELLCEEIHRCEMLPDD